MAAWGIIGIKNAADFVLGWKTIPFIRKRIVASGAETAVQEGMSLRRLLNRSRWGFLSLLQIKPFD